MGLSIGNYSSTYGTLHELRGFAVKVENNPKPLRCDNRTNSNNCGSCVYCLLNDAHTTEDMAKITKYYAFINHSDCDGGYISFSEISESKITPKDWVNWADLDRLKVEVEELNSRKEVLNGYLLTAWENFYEDVMSEDFCLRFS